MIRVIVLALAVACSSAPERQAATPGPGGNGQTSAASGAENGSGPQALAADAFPAKVGGFPFGATEEQFKSQCEGGGGTVLVEQAGACSQPAVPLPAQVSNVGVAYCAGRACEYRVVTTQLERWVAALEEKYGKAQSEGPPQSCGNAYPPVSTFRRVWFFGNRETPVGILRAIRECDGQGEPVSAITYENAVHIRERAQQDDERRKNY